VRRPCAGILSAVPPGLATGCGRTPALKRWAIFATSLRDGEPVTQLKRLGYCHNFPTGRDVSRRGAGYLSAVPPGLATGVAGGPSAEALGYFHSVPTGRGGERSFAASLRGGRAILRNVPDAGQPSGKVGLFSQRPYGTRDVRWPCAGILSAVPPGLEAGCGRTQLKRLGYCRNVPTGRGAGNPAEKVGLLSQRPYGTGGPVERSFAAYGMRGNPAERLGYCRSVPTGLAM
jgi:hypothetical protein